MTRLLALVLAVSAVSFAPRLVDAGACARPGIPPAPLTPDGTKLAKGGGVVMQMEDSAKAPKWVFAGKSKATTKVRVLGPGLAVYEPPAGGSWTLQDDKGTPSIKIEAGADAKAPPAPALRSVKYFSSMSRRGQSTNVTVEVTGQPPDGVVALLAYDDKGAVMSWGKVWAGDPVNKTSQFAIYYSGSCSVLPNGTRPINPSDKVKLAWLDASGQISPMVAATVVDASPKNQKVAPY